jgi:hypothetical protein
MPELAHPGVVDQQLEPWFPSNALTDTAKASCGRKVRCEGFAGHPVGLAQLVSECGESTSAPCDEHEIKPITSQGT